jgi:hypothetical protein
MVLSELMQLAIRGILECGLVVLVFVSQVLGPLVVDGGKGVHKPVGEICYVLVLLGGGIRGLFRWRQQLPQCLLFD